MKIYVGQTRSRALIADLQDRGWGEVASPRELPPRRRPWVYDNGAFVAWRKGKPFDEARFLAGFQIMQNDDPDFIVCPDIVAGGQESLAFSLEWRRRLRYVGPLYLAVQDGMEPPEVRRALLEFDGLFVGGTLKWKLRTAETWVALAHEMGRHGRKPCHVGRVGTGRRIRWARRIGADSIDSSLPLWSADHLRVFAQAISEPLHPELEWG